MPKKLIIPYVSEQSNVFKKIKRPKLNISIYSKYLKCWISIEDVLGKVRFNQEKKLPRLTEIMEQHFDFQAVYQGLGLAD